MAEKTGGERCEVKPPKDFQIPEGKQSGDSFDIVCTFRVEQDGTLCMTKLGDSDLPTEKEEQKSKPSYAPEAAEIASQAQASQGGGRGMGQS